MNLDSLYAMLDNLLETYGSRVVAGLVASAAAYAETRFQIVIAPDTKASMVGGALATYGTIYPIIHRTLSKRWNPGDAASSHIATVEKVEAKQLKRNTEEARVPNYPE